MPPKALSQMKHILEDLDRKTRAEEESADIEELRRFLVDGNWAQVPPHLLVIVDKPPEGHVVCDEGTMDEFGLTCPMPKRLPLMFTQQGALCVPREELAAVEDMRKHPQRTMINMQASLAEESTVSDSTRRFLQRVRNGLLRGGRGGKAFPPSGPQADSPEWALLKTLLWETWQEDFGKPFLEPAASQEPQLDREYLEEVWTVFATTLTHLKALASLKTEKLRDEQLKAFRDAFQDAVTGAAAKRNAAVQERNAMLKKLQDEAAALSAKLLEQQKDTAMWREQAEVSRKANADAYERYLAQTNPAASKPQAEQGATAAAPEALSVSEQLIRMYGSLFINPENPDDVPEELNTKELPEAKERLPATIPALQAKLSQEDVFGRFIPEPFECILRVPRGYKLEEELARGYKRPVQSLFQEVPSVGGGGLQDVDCKVPDTMTPWNLCPHVLGLQDTLLKRESLTLPAKVYIGPTERNSSDGLDYFLAGERLGLEPKALLQEEIRLLLPWTQFVHSMEDLLAAATAMEEQAAHVKTVQGTIQDFMRITVQRHVRFTPMPQTFKRRSVMPHVPAWKVLSYADTQALPQQTKAMTVLFVISALHLLHEAVNTMGYSSVNSMLEEYQKMAPAAHTVFANLFSPAASMSGTASHIPVFLSSSKALALHPAFEFINLFMCLTLAKTLLHDVRMDMRRMMYAGAMPSRTIKQDEDPAALLREHRDAAGEALYDNMYLMHLYRHMELLLMSLVDTSKLSAIMTRAQRQTEQAITAVLQRLQRHGAEELEEADMLLRAEERLQQRVTEFQNALRAEEASSGGITGVTGMTGGTTEDAEDAEGSESKEGTPRIAATTVEEEFLGVSEDTLGTTMTQQQQALEQLQREKRILESRARLEAFQEALQEARERISLHPVVQSFMVPDAELFQGPSTPAKRALTPLDGIRESLLRRLLAKREEPSREATPWFEAYTQATNARNIDAVAQRDFVPKAIYWSAIGSAPWWGSPLTPVFLLKKLPKIGKKENHNTATLLQAGTGEFLESSLTMSGRGTHLWSPGASLPKLLALRPDDGTLLPHAAELGAANVYFSMDRVGFKALNSPQTHAALMAELMQPSEADKPAKPWATLKAALVLLPKDNEDGSPVVTEEEVPHALQTAAMAATGDDAFRVPKKSVQELPPLFWALLTSERAGDCVLAAWVLAAQVALTPEFDVLDDACSQLLQHVLTAAAALPATHPASKRTAAVKTQGKASMTFFGALVQDAFASIAKSSKQRDAFQKLASPPSSGVPSVTHNTKSPVKQVLPIVMPQLDKSISRGRWMQDLEATIAQIENVVGQGAFPPRQGIDPAQQQPLDYEYVTDRYFTVAAASGLQKDSYTLQLNQERRKAELQQLNQESRERLEKAAEARRREEEARQREKAIVQLVDDTMQVFQEGDDGKDADEDTKALLQNTIAQLVTNPLAKDVSLRLNTIAQEASLSKEPAVIQRGTLAGKINGLLKPALEKAEKAKANVSGGTLAGGGGSPPRPKRFWEYLAPRRVTGGAEPGDKEQEASSPSRPAGKPSFLADIGKVFQFRNTKNTKNTKNKRKKKPTSKTSPTETSPAKPSPTETIPTETSPSKPNPTETGPPKESPPEPSPQPLPKEEAEAPSSSETAETPSKSDAATEDKALAWPKRNYEFPSLQTAWKYILVKDYAVQGKLLQTVAPVTDAKNPLLLAHYLAVMFWAFTTMFIRDAALQREMLETVANEHARLVPKKTVKAAPKLDNGAAAQNPAVKRIRETLKFWKTFTVFKMEDAVPSNGKPQVDAKGPSRTWSHFLWVVSEEKPQVAKRVVLQFATSASETLDLQLPKKYESYSDMTLDDAALMPNWKEMVQVRKQLAGLTPKVFMSTQLAGSESSLSRWTGYMNGAPKVRNLALRYADALAADPMFQDNTGALAVPPKATIRQALLVNRPSLLAAHEALENDRQEVKRLQAEALAAKKAKEAAAAAAEKEADQAKDESKSDAVNPVTTEAGK